MAVSAERDAVAADNKVGPSARVTWTFTADDTGDAVSLGEYADRSVQAAGTFGSGTVTIEGSNDGTNWATLNDFEGDALTFTGAAIKQVAEATAYIRAKVTGSTNPALVVTLAAFRKTP